jgi:hypothetical protein
MDTRSKKRRGRGERSKGAGGRKSPLRRTY